MEILQNVLTKNFKRYLIYYNLYGFIFFLLNLCVVSVVASFHFMLEHKIGSVEDWIFRHSWELILVGKFLAFVTTLRIVNYLFHAGNPLIDFFRQTNQRLKGETITIIGFLFLVILISGKVQFSRTMNENFNHQILSFWGTFFYYFLDFLMLAYLRFLYPLEGKRYQELLYSVLFPALFYFYSIISTDYDHSLSHLIFLNMLLAMQIYIHFNLSWVNVGLFLIAFVAPLSSLIGLDLIWGNRYSPFILSKSFSISSAIIFFLGSIIYILIKTKKIQLRSLA